MLGDALRKSGQAGELDRVHRFGLGIPHNKFLYNKLEHNLHSRSEQGLGLHTAHSKPQTDREPGTLPLWSGAGMEPGTSPWWS